MRFARKPCTGLQQQCMQSLPGENIGSDIIKAWRMPREFSQAPIEWGCQQRAVLPDLLDDGNGGMQMMSLPSTYVHLHAAAAQQDMAWFVHSIHNKLCIDAGSSLHRGHLRAPNGLRRHVDEVCQLSYLLASTEAGCYVTQAGQILTKDHGTNEAVVTGGVHDALLVLNGPSGGGHTLCEADKHLCNKDNIASLMTEVSRNHLVVLLVQQQEQHHCGIGVAGPAAWFVSSSRSKSTACTGFRQQDCCLKVAPSTTLAQKVVVNIKSCAGVLRKSGQGHSFQALHHTPHLQTEAELWAALLRHSARAWTISIAAHISARQIGHMCITFQQKYAHYVEQITPINLT